MIGYVTFGTNDMARACAFYDALLATLGAGRFMEAETYVAWAVSPTQPALCVFKPHDQKPATVGNGTMVSLSAGSREDVDRMHARALALGGTDEGAPGERFRGFYAGYWRDIDGNKLNFFHMGA